MRAACMCFAIYTAADQRRGVVRDRVLTGDFCCDTCSPGKLPVPEVRSLIPNFIQTHVRAGHEEKECRPERPGRDRRAAPSDRWLGSCTPLSGWSDASDLEFS